MYMYTWTIVWPHISQDPIKCFQHKQDPPSQCLLWCENISLKMCCNLGCTWFLPVAQWISWCWIIVSLTKNPNYAEMRVLHRRGPGVMGEQDAVKQVKLHDLIHSLSWMYCAIADCAYTPSDEMIPLYWGSNANEPQHDNSNFLHHNWELELRWLFAKW